VNKTDLHGEYTFRLRWSRSDANVSGATDADEPPDLFTALKEQVGLKLIPARNSIPVLVIDSVTLPSPN